MRRVRRGVAATLASAALATGLLTAGAPVAAAGPAERQQQLQSSLTQLRSQLEGTSAELADAVLALEQAEQRLPAARAELETARAAVAQAQERAAEIAAQLAVAEADYAEALRQLRDAAVRLARTKADAGRIANEAYRSSGVLAGIAIAMDAETPNDLIDRAHVVQTAMGVQNAAADRVRQEQAEIEARREHLEAVRERIRGLRAEAEANLKAARRAEQEAAERQAEVEQLVAQAEETARVVAARREQESARLRSLEAEQAGLRAELARRAREAQARASAGERASRSSGRGILASPVSAGVTSHYGYRTHPVYGSRRMHSGTDFSAACGTPVRAAAAGTVVRAGGAGGYGNQIVLDHGLVAGSALATSYNHLQGFAVRSGSVSRGQVIGYIGTTGTSTGCHLHFEVFDGGVTVDPMRWL